MKLEDAAAQLAREIARARGRLSAERALALAAPVLIALGLWAALWLAGGGDLLPPIAQSLAVAAFMLGALVFAARAAARYRAPSLTEARQRLAVDSRLEPGAFEALDDLPAKLDPLGVALWRREQDAARARAARAKAGPIRPNLNAADPFRLRFVAVLAFVGGALIAGPAFEQRLTRAFVPDPGPLVGDGPIEVEAWVTPAAYTRAAPLTLSDRIGARVETPPSVEATVRVTGPRGFPRLIFEGRGGRREAEFVRAADGAYEAKLAIPGPGRLRVVRFLERAAWRLSPAPDVGPRAQFVEQPRALQNGRIAFAWSATDDYGVRAMALRIAPVNPPPGLRGAAPIDTAFETPAGEPREAEAAVELDLFQHPYAGMDVEVRLVAFDALGQVGQSEPVRFTLPEKVFLQPLARAAIEVRAMVLREARPYRPMRRAWSAPAMMEWFEPLFGKQMLAIKTDDHDPRLERAPAGIRQAVRHLDALTMRADDGYFRDNAVFLGLASARAELRIAREIAETRIAADTLWRTALRAEYGGAADARRALEAAQKALADALASGASQERLAQLMQALREATDAYLQALVQEAMRAGETPQTQEDTQEQTELSERDIDNLMREVERMMQDGRTEEAQALLDQMAGLLQNLDVRLSEGGEGESGEQQGGEGGDESLSQSMQELSEAIGEQRALNDETSRQEENQGEGEGEAGEQGGQGGLAERQRQIRESLGQAENAAREGGAPSSQSLRDAEQAMRRAEQALQRGDFEGARAAQDDALAGLRRGAGELAAEMRRRGGEEGDASGPGERDPLGRMTGGAGAGEGETSVPTEADRVRAREILDDIRRRAEDPSRPDAERDYLNRLLDRFSGT